MSSKKKSNIIFFYKIVEQYALTAEHERSPSRMYYYYRPRRNKAAFAYGIIILLFALQLILGRYISSRMINDFRIFNIIHFLFIFINRTIND